MEREENSVKSIKSVDDLNALIKFVDEQLNFRGKTFKEWSELITLPAVGDTVDKETIVMLNTRLLNFAEIVYRNMAIAKNTYNSAKAKYTTNLILFKNNFLAEIEEYNKNNTLKRKAPSQDSLNTKAEAACVSDFKTLVMSEMVVEFWKCQVDKIKSYDSRITSLSISQHNDEKYSNY